MAVVTGTSDAAPEYDSSKRARSLIVFSYVPLRDVLAMILKVEARSHRCRVDELAADLDQQKTNGAFRSRLSAGRMFGVTESSVVISSLPSFGSRCAILIRVSMR